MAIDHPAVFGLAFLRTAPDKELGADVRSAAREGSAVLTQLVQRLADADLLGGRDVTQATREFSALCLGMAVTELLNPTLLEPDPERAWRAAFGNLLSGFRTPAQRTRPRRPRTESRSTKREGETGTLGR
jgi:hypothetical protein